MKTILLYRFTRILWYIVSSKEIPEALQGFSELWEILGKLSV